MLPAALVSNIQFAIREVNAFIGHSFADDDKELIDLISAFLTKLGMKVESGRRPEPSGISDKVRERILAAEVFVAIFTRKSKAPKSDRGTSAWVIEEKAFALSAGKKLLLFVEEGVEEFGGLQGDYEYIQFRRDNLGAALVHAIDYVLAATSVPFTVKHDGHNSIIDTCISNWTHCSSSLLQRKWDRRSCCSLACRSISAVT